MRRTQCVLVIDFVYYSEKSEIKIYKTPEGLLKIISDYYYALVALTLMIAVSKSEDKETMIKVTLNLINRLTIKDQT